MSEYGIFLRGKEIVISNCMCIYAYICTRMRIDIHARFVLAMASL